MEFNLFHMGNDPTFDFSKQYDTAIIGGGPAGLTASLYAGRYRLDTVLIEKELLCGGQMLSTEWIENYPGFEESMQGNALSKKMEIQAISAGVTILRAAAESVDFSREIKTIVTTKGIVQAKTVILCTGTHPRSLMIEGEAEYKGKGISYCATCDGPFYTDKTVAVIGGGNTALQESLFLSKYVRHLYLIHRRGSFRADKILQEKVRANPKIELLLETVPLSADFSDREHRKLRIMNKNQEETLVIDALFIFAGILPNNSFFPDSLAMDEAGYVVTDAQMKTNLDGIYAIGDVRAKPLRQIATAIGDGATAAHAIEQALSGFSV